MLQYLNHPFPPPKKRSKISICQYLRQLIYLLNYTLLLLLLASHIKRKTLSIFTHIAPLSISLPIQVHLAILLSISWTQQHLVYFTPLTFSIEYHHLNHLLLSLGIVQAVNAKEMDYLDQPKVDFYFKPQQIFLIIFFSPHLHYQQKLIFLQSLRIFRLDSPLKGLQNAQVVQPPKTLDYFIMIFLINISAPVQHIATC